MQRLSTPTSSPRWLQPKTVGLTVLIPTLVTPALSYDAVYTSLTKLLLSLSHFLPHQATAVPYAPNGIYHTVMEPDTKVVGPPWIFTLQNYVLSKLSFTHVTLYQLCLCGETKQIKTLAHPWTCFTLDPTIPDHRQRDSHPNEQSQSNLSRIF